MIYPPADISRSVGEKPQRCNAVISSVQAGTPADDAGFAPGCAITAVDGQPVRDIIDWQWLTAGDEMTVSYIDLDGEEGDIDLWREEGEPWGFGFDDFVFDRIIQCRNACTFCFMRQLPKGMRPSLYVRDDDYRLSFLAGTFVTFTNLSGEDEARIIEQRISPLRVSLQAVSADVRARLIGRHASHGIEVLERLLKQGICFHAQIVLVPGENDGDELVKTLNWAYGHPGILTVGIVPLGFTAHQNMFDRSYDDPCDAQAVLDQVAPFQRKSIVERGYAWAYAADEFYCNAYGAAVLEKLPDESFYGSFDMFEDGIGMVRQFANEWQEALDSGDIDRCAAKLRGARITVRMIAGEAQKPFLDTLIRNAGIDDALVPLYVRNEYFGGNVDVTGLLTGSDIERAIVRSRDQKPVAADMHTLYALPRVALNDKALFLDDMGLDALIASTGTDLRVVSCSPKEFFRQIAE